MNPSFPYILGPCSAESQAQIMECARFASSIPNLFGMRAGVWKPRTRPDSFEGYGEIALKWLAEAKKEYGIKVGVEVAYAHHVELCLQYGIDFVWIGARTSCNPFSVQEIADALQGVQIPVLVKNPITPDMALWLGALERIEKAKVSKVYAIHRGFDMYRSEPYRNAPLWEIPIEIKRLRPDIPIFCDPSHICGRTELIASVSQKSIDLEMDGLMLETHPEPSQALTDAKQQLNFKQVEDLMLKMNFKKISHIPTDLQKLRILVDEVDEEVLTLLHKRLEIVKKMGELKKEEHMSVLQMDRWAEIVQTRMNFAKQKNMDPEFVHELLQCIHKASIQIQDM